MSQFCSNCGTAYTSSDAKFCRNCGMPKNDSEKIMPDSQINNTEVETKSIENIFEPQAINYLAPIESNFYFDFTMPQLSNTLRENILPVINTVNPFKFLFGEFFQLLKGIGNVFRDKKKIVIILVLSIIWVVLLLLPALGIEIPGEKIISWLTFAQGGMRGGVAGFLGGIFGKGLVAFLITELFNRKDKQNKSDIDVKDNKRATVFGQLGLGLFISGFGIAFVMYNLMSGDNSMQNSMIGIVSAVLIIKAIRSQTGFLNKFLDLVGKQFSKGNTHVEISPNHFMGGMTTGFFLVIPLSIFGISWLAYIVGGIIFIFGTIIALIARKKQQKGVIA